MNKKSPLSKDNDDVVEALKSTELTNIYFNEFALGFTKNDAFILLRRNGKKEAILNFSYATAKSLADNLIEAIKNFEEKNTQ